MSSRTDGLCDCPGACGCESSEKNDDQEHKEIQKLVQKLIHLASILSLPSLTLMDGDKTVRSVCESMRKAQDIIFGSEDFAPISMLVREAISSVDILLREPLDSANSFLEEAICSVQMEAFGDAKKEFHEARINAVKAFNLARRTNDMAGLCVSSRFWILCDIGLISYDENTHQFIQPDMFDGKRKEICFGKVKIRIEKLLEAIDETQSIEIQQKKELVCRILTRVWPFLVQFSPDNNIPPFSPR